MVGNITFGGLASGIDTNSIIDQLIQIERRPIFLAESRLMQVQQRSDAFGLIGTSLSGLLSRAQTLAKPETYSARSTSVLAKDVDANKVRATASAGAAVGSYSITVSALASSTTVVSDVPVGSPIDADAPMDEAGWGEALTTGTFSINGTSFTIDPATATTFASANSVGAAFDATAKLDSAGLDIAPTSGTFEINGVSINYDVESDTLNDVIRYINNSSAGVTASYDDATKSLTLTHETIGAGETITVANGTGNFLEAFKFLDGGGATIGTTTAGTDVRSLNDLISEVNNAGIGVTLSIVNDAHGRPNLLEVASGSDVQLGSGGDTSNFLSLTSLLQSPPGSTRTSQRGLGAVSRSADLEDARLATALTQTSGSFKINGVEITYDATAESLSNLMTRINNSDAGVTVTYDVYADRLKVTNDDTGALAVQFEDVTGNMLDALGLLGGTQTMGQNAAYAIDGGATRYSTSNTISDAIDGVTLTINDTTEDTVKVSVALQSSGTSQAVDGFVQEFNKTLDLLGQLTAYNEGGNNGVLFGDGTVRRIEQGMRSIVTRSVEGVSGGLRTLSDIGISFGAIGSAVGTANKLTFNASKFAAAMERDPEAVGQLLTVFTASASLVPGGTGWIASISGKPSASDKSGRYTITTTADGDLQATFQPDDGSTAVVSTGSIAAGGTNDTLIPGVTITAAGVLVDGSNEIVISATSEGFAKTLSEYIDSLTRTGGLLENRNEEMSNVISDINAQIDRLERRVTAREEQLVKKFTAMEMAIAQMQSQQQALTAMQGQLAGLSAARKK